MAKIQTRKAVEIKIATVVAAVVILRDFDLAAIEAAMREITGGTSDYFDNELAAVDVSACDLADSAIDWVALIALFKSHSLNLVAVRGARPEMEQAILAQGLSLDASVKPRGAAQEESEPQPVAVQSEPEPPAAAQPAPSPEQPAVASAPARSTMIVDTPVRSGQRIYARGSDLVVTAIVNPGAELIADGSIHIYAPLRGRALAGASGDASSRIFSMSMEAELVSIAGMYRTFEEGWPKELAKKAVQVSLAGDRIDFRSMAAGETHSKK
ncbi:MAG TPA: septum site-determining protein MinC [Burkholderiaceae bacterium]